jgi:leucyl/phenylalanyl-tRNA---protein transferase
MPVYRLSEELSFPHPALAAEGGLLAVGGDLRPERIVLAYRNGIFPWYSEGRPLLWWCPAPRLVLFPGELRVWRSLAKVLRRNPYRITLDTAFAAVIRACAEVPRSDQDGTWITQDLERAFVRLHELGIAHSVEAWDGDELVGGVYGLAIGRTFFGESMFAKRPDASKVAFVRLVRQLQAWDFDLVDCQVVTEHLLRFGAREIELDEFLERLGRSVDRPPVPGPWRFDAPDEPR